MHVVTNITMAPGFALAPHSCRPVLSNACFLPLNARWQVLMAATLELTTLLVTVGKWPAAGDPSQSYWEIADAAADDEQPTSDFDDFYSEESFASQDVRSHLPSNGMRGWTRAVRIDASLNSSLFAEGVPVRRGKVRFVGVPKQPL